VKLVLHLNNFGWPIPPASIPDLLADVASTAEGGGFDGIAVADHLWQHPMMGGPEAPCLEAYTTLTFLAAHTRSVRLFTLATGAHFRHPAVLGKTVTTLDVLSGGRAWLGIGAGHYEEECVGLGVPFPPTATRFELLEDAIEVCRRMWSDDDAGYRGHHVDATRLLDLPRTGRRPPILIAGDGERRTLPLVARYADACSLRPTPELPHKLDVLRRRCDEAGTDFNRIEKTCAWLFDVDDDGPKTSALLDQLERFTAMGIDTVIGGVPGLEQRQPLERVVRHILPRL
jgi:F420-dependent oxidoreductase-like protein